VTELRPSYYLVHATPDGPRYAYPHPDVPKDAAWNGTKDGDWTSPDGAVKYVPGPARSWENPSTGWLVADRPLSSVRLAWTASGGLSNRWRKRAEVHPDDRVIVTAWEQAPDEPTASDFEHLGNDDHDDDTCLTCAVVRRVYEPVPNPRVPREHVVDLTGWQPLPGTPDPDTNRPWTVDDPSTLAVYGRHTAHLWPGTMSGFRAAVVDALWAHPWVAAIGARRDRGGFILGPVYESSSRKGEVIVSVPIPWNVPQKRARTKHDRGRGPFYDKVAITHRVELVVPDQLAAASKAEALARWDDTVRGWTTRFLPDIDKAPAACSSCRGRGFYLRSGQ
jgi:hypothetical protein